MNGSHNIGGNGIAGSGLGDTEVRNLNLTCKGNDYILRLDVSVNDVLFMSSLDTHSDLNGYTYCFFIRKTGFFLNIFLESDTLNKLHNYIVDALLFAYIIDIYYIGMHETCSRLSLYTEFGYEVLILRKFLL